MARLGTMPRRSYDQYCSLARALDVLGERWTLLIVRELLAGPRRYSDLHADLPGVSTDVLAARLKELEADGLVARRRVSPRGAAHVYELTQAGHEVLPVLACLAAWGRSRLGPRRPTDALRSHWFALPLLEYLGALLRSRPAGGDAGRDAGPSASGAAGPSAGGDAATVEVRLDEGVFHLHPGGDRARTGYAEGPVERPDAVLSTDAGTVADLLTGATSLPEARRQGRLELRGRRDVVDALLSASRAELPVPG